MSANERYEYMAELFYKEKSMVAPGKDDCLMTHTQEERVEAWGVWVEGFYSDLFVMHKLAND